MQRAVGPLHQVCKLRIHAHWCRDLHLTAVRIHGQGWSQTALSIVTAEHSPKEDFLPGAVGRTGILAGRRDRGFRRGGCWGRGDGGVITGQEGLAALGSEDAEGVIRFGRRGVVNV